MAAVVLAGDAVNLLHVDGVGCAGRVIPVPRRRRRTWACSHLRLICALTGIVVKAPPDSPVPLPHPPLPRRRMVSIGTPWNGLHSIGYHSIGYHCYPFQWSGMDTMALDTNRSTTGGAVRGGYARSRSWRARIRRREWFFGRPEAGKWVRSARLRTPVRRAITIIIARRTDPLAARSGVAQVRTTWVT